MKQPLVEGIDFYMEGDRFVFTAVYHRKRGYCCNSSGRGPAYPRCRHCPYENAPEGEAPPAVIESAPGIKR